MATDPTTLNLEKALQILRRRAALIAFCAILVGASAFAFSELQTKQYTATATLLFRDPSLDQQASGLTQPTSGVDPQRQASTNVELVKLGDVAGRTAQALDHGLTPGQVGDAVNVSAAGQTSLADVAATWPNATIARNMANTFAREFIEIRREVDRRRVLDALALVQKQVSVLPDAQRNSQQGQSLIDRAESLRVLASLQTGNAELVQAATVPSSPSSPKVARNTVLGVVLGLFLGLGLAFLFARLDRRLKEPDDLREAFDLPLLGMVPDSPAYGAATANGHGRVPLPAAEAEAFRMLRAHLRYFNVDRDVRTVLVTSPAPGDGKTTVARNLAEVAATMGTKTLLLEADMRRPNLARQYGLNDVAGLGEILIGAISISEAIGAINVTSGINGTAKPAKLRLLVAGATPPNPAELLESQAMADVLAWVAEHYELVVVDTPPLTVVSDAIPLLRKVDGVIIVSRLGKNTRDAAERMTERLASLGAPVLGVVGNALKEHSGGGYEYAYAYYEPAPRPKNGSPAPAPAETDPAERV